jgi:hypothetical protein
LLKLSQTSKMPCPSFALPAGQKCLTGRRLLSIPGSVCQVCYARKGRGAFHNVRAARESNYENTLVALKRKASTEAWSKELARLIVASGTAWFRWHDSGDVLSLMHLRAICRVCELTSDVRHWLPTREYKFVDTLYRTCSKAVPHNLTIRLSAHMLGETLTHALPTSSVGSGAGHLCLATYNHELTSGKCGGCRACWDKNVKNVDYKRH